MATYTLNQGIVIDGAISVSGNFSAMSGTIYTNPSNTCAFVNIFYRPITISSTGIFQIFIGGSLIFIVNFSAPTITSGTNLSGSIAASSFSRKERIFVGPNQSITYSINVSSTWNISVTGIRYKNMV
ncbi:MAG: hypothetical protein QXT45_04300 [Candidatus Bilamarchaeaceae archaeon]